ncbi:cytochrome c oxidase subunit II [Salinigranum halophilum]|uniref:cytochrome c oxidase subunit II n=1 Tax=Salinigranum halophilum TaxID=2565931 RepID=UPI0010A780D7|nr:cytochrome c oxidase subunit II [Salinigranum halophilum]
MGRVRVTRVAQFVVVALGIALVAGLLASPAAAQSVNRNAIDDLNEQLLYVALPLVLFVEVTLVYALYRFRNNENPKPTAKDSALEITWTAATGVILLFVGISAFFVLANPYISPAAASQPAAETAEDPVEIEVVAYQWGWEFRYQGENVTTQKQLVLPVDRDVRVSLTTRDVIHSFYVPQLGLKQDVIPGQTTELRTRATETGEYTLYCAELCGVGHTRMHGTVAVLSQDDYSAWLDDQRTDT